jgi:hypothetical protein
MDHEGSFYGLPQDPSLAIYQEGLKSQIALDAVDTYLERMVAKIVKRVKGEVETEGLEALHRLLDSEEGVVEMEEERVRMRGLPTTVGLVELLAGMLNGQNPPGMGF